MSGLLKCVAIELKLTAEKIQLSRFDNLCRILFGIAQNVSKTSENFQMELGHYEVDSSVQKKTVASKLLICELLNSLEFEMKPVDRPKWDFFDNSLMQQLIQSCEISTAASVKLVDVKKIHAILKDELNSVQKTIATGQRQ
jgi:nuclear pore complex protein Nup205